MATYFARKAGNVNATDVWATTPGGTAGAQTFVAGDILVANSFAITINVDTNLGTGTVTNDNRDGATQGGNFTLSNDVTLTANVVAGNAASTNCVVFSSSGSAAIVGNVTGGGGSAAIAAANTSTGTLTITGACTGGTAGDASGANISSTGNLVVVGNCTGGSGSNASGVNKLSTGSVTVTGNVTGGSGGQGVRINTAGTVTITGTCTGGTVQPGVTSTSTATVNITGTAVGGSGASAFGALNNSTGTMTVTRAKGGALASSTFGVASPSTGATSVSEVEWGDLGASPTSGAIRLTTASTNVAVMYVPSAAKKTLVDANASGLMPSASDVRSGTAYNGGNSTGTCAVPAAGSVALGVAVDNTTGTAVLTQANVETALGAFSSGRLSNCATVASVGQQLADALTVP